jgi:DNA-binding NarL/FixJ family response regulator
MTSKTGGKAAQKRLRVLVVDDHEVIHFGFQTLLAGEPWVDRFLSAQTGDNAVELARRHRPHVALVDLLLGEESGADLTGRLLEVSPATRVLLMSGAGRISNQSARAAGAFGFVPKEWSARDLAHAARMVGLGMELFATEPAEPRDPLSPREREVLLMIAGGATNKEIAERLFLSPHTVKDHTSALYRKLGVRNRAEAILRAQRLGLVS